MRAALDVAGAEEEGEKGCASTYEVPDDGEVAERRQQRLGEGVDHARHQQHLTPTRRPSGFHDHGSVRRCLPVGPLLLVLTSAKSEITSTREVRWPDVK